MMIERRPVAWHWQRMPAATLGGGAGIIPVLNQWYTVLDTVRNVRVRNVAIYQSNDEAAQKQLQVRFTINGVASAVDASNSASGAWNGFKIFSVNDTPTYTANEVDSLATYVNLNYSSIKIEIRTTSALGTNPLLKCTVQYEQLKRVVK